MLLAKAFALRLQDIRRRLQQQYGKDVPLTEENLGIWKVEMAMNMLAQMLQELYLSQLVARVVPFSSDAAIADLFRRYGRMGIAPFLLASYLRGGREGVGKAWTEVRQAENLPSTMRDIPSEVRSFLRKEKVKNFLEEIRSLASKVVENYVFSDEHERAVDNAVGEFLAAYFPSQLIRDHIKVVTKDILRAISVPPDEVRAQIDEFFSKISQQLGQIPVSVFSSKVLEQMVGKELTPEEVDLIVDYLAPAFLLSHYANRIGGSAEVTLMDELIRWGVIGREEDIGLTGLNSYYPIFRWSWSGELDKEIDRDAVEPPYKEMVGLRGATYTGGVVQDIGVGVRLSHEILEMMGYEVKDTSPLPELLRRNFPLYGIKYPLEDLIKVFAFLARQVEKKGEVVIDRQRMPSLFELVTKTLMIEAENEVRLTKEHKSRLENVAGLISQVLGVYRLVEEGRRGKAVWDYSRMLDEFDGVIIPTLSAITNTGVGSPRELHRLAYGAAVEAALYLADNRETQENLLANFKGAVFSFRGHTGRAETGLTAEGLSFTGVDGKEITIRDLVLDMAAPLPRTPEGEINWGELERRIRRIVDNFSILVGLPAAEKGEPEIEEEEPQVEEAIYERLFHFRSAGKVPQVHRFLLIPWRESRRPRFLEGEVTWREKVKKWREVFANWGSLSEDERKTKLLEIYTEMHSLVAGAWGVVADRIANSLEGQVALFVSNPEGLVRWLRNLKSGSLSYVTFTQMVEEGERPIDERLADTGVELGEEAAEEGIWLYLVSKVASPFVGGDIEGAKRNLSFLANALDETGWDFGLVDDLIEEMKAGVAPDVRELKEKVFKNNADLFQNFVNFLEREWDALISQIEAEEEEEVEPLPPPEEPVPTPEEEEPEVPPEVPEPEEEEMKPSEEELPEELPTEEEEREGWVSLLKFNLLSEVLQFVS